MRSSRNSIPIWKLAVTLLFIVVIAAILMPGIKQGRLLWPSLSQCRWGWVVAAVLCQTGVYLTTSAIFGAAIRALGGRISPVTLLFVAMAFLFTTKAFAVAGLATLVLLLARRSIGADVAQAAAGTFYLADYAGFIILGVGVYFGAGAVVASSSGLAASVALLVAGTVSTIALLRAPRAVTAAVDYVALGGARLLRRPDPNHTASKARSVVESFYSRWNELAKRRRVLVLTTVWALAMHLCETATVACCSRAFGAPVSVASAAAGYVAGNLAALVSFLPGGVGFFEGAMAAALNHLGHAPLGSALAATLLYRVIALWLPLPIVFGVVREIRAKGHPATAA